LSRETSARLKHLTAIVERFHRGKMVVAGDALADQFLYGEISRVSREAPVLILRHEHTETTPGGAANCAVNLAALGAQVALIATVGEDSSGEALRAQLKAAGVGIESVVASPSQSTTTKVRILAGQAHSPRQQVIRVDYEGGPALEEGLRQRLQRSLREQTENANAVIISDYNYGVADEELTSAVREVARDRNIPVVIDSRFRLRRFAGFTSATPNEQEVERVLGKQISDSVEMDAAGARLREELGHLALLITRGSQGMVLFEPNTPPLHIAAVGAVEPVDVTGAGDTVIATYTLALASGATYSEAAHLANHAGGLVVMKRGTASIDVDELLSSLQRWQKD
jgi:rfaE bifunctional protein kinase chain/domain